LVIFTADNGPETLNRYQGSSYSYGIPGPLRGMKLWTTDAGFRVAGIMRWPEKIKRGQESDQPVSALDFLPTFCKIAGVELPPNIELDGSNFLPALNGGEIQRQKPLVWAYYNALNEHMVAMRDGPFKVLAKLDLDSKYQNLTNRNIEEIRNAKFVDFEIYEITADIHEDHDLSEENRVLLTEMKKKLEENYRALLEDSHIWTVFE